MFPSEWAPDSYILPLNREGKKNQRTCRSVVSKGHCDRWGGMWNIKINLVVHGKCSIGSNAKLTISSSSLVSLFTIYRGICFLSFYGPHKEALKIGGPSLTCGQQKSGVPPKTNRTKQGHWTLKNKYTQSIHAVEIFSTWNDREKSYGRAVNRTRILLISAQRCNFTSCFKLNNFVDFVSRLCR